MTSIVLVHRRRQLGWRHHPDRRPHSPRRRWYRPVPSRWPPGIGRRLLAPDDALLPRVHRLPEGAQRGRAVLEPPVLMVDPVVLCLVEPDEPEQVVLADSGKQV